MQSKIMFIDDEPGVLEALEWTFVDEPYECLTCQKPEQALQLMAQNEIAVVVSDQRMSEMEGADFLNTVKRQWPATNRILMTAYQEMGIALDAINKGQVCNLIFKPWDEAELKRVIKGAVDEYQLRITSKKLSEKLRDETKELADINHKLKKKNQYLLERLQQAHKMEALGNLASGIAHDFNNILFIIKGCLDLVIFDNSLAPGVYSKLSQALQASNLAKDLVSQILSFSSSKEQTRTPVEFGPLVREALGFIRTILPTNVEIRQNIGVFSERVLLDPTKIYQILMNLCTNGADAMHDRNGILSVCVSRTEIDQVDPTDPLKLLPGRYLQLTVEDNGEGIEPDIVPQIFNPYFTTKANNGGTGLGLAMTDQIVQELGGRISVSSQLGRGSVFRVYLPLFENSQNVSDLEMLKQSCSPN